MACMVLPDTGLSMYLIFFHERGVYFCVAVVLFPCLNYVGIEVEEQGEGVT
jgi:hypothetical protein